MIRREDVCPLFRNFLEAGNLQLEAVARVQSWREAAQLPNLTIEPGARLRLSFAAADAIAFASETV